MNKLLVILGIGAGLLVLTQRKEVAVPLPSPTHSGQEPAPDKERVLLDVHWET